MLHVFTQRFAPLFVCLALAAPAAAQYARVTIGLGNVPPNGTNGAGVLSADGRYVAFESDASNLVAGDTNQSTDVFVRDRLTSTTTRVSVAEDGQERTGNSGVVVDIGGVAQIDISDDGRYVVFMSRAPLATGDSATCEYLGEDGNCPDIYLRDRIGGSTTRVSLVPGGGQPNGASHNPKMSGDGRWIVFESEATNLVSGDFNGVTDAFLFDRLTGAMSRVSVASGGPEVDLPSFAPDISGDGNVIAFVSASTQLSADADTVPCQSAPPACLRPFVVDRQAGTTRRIPAPAIVTSRVVSGPNGPLTITYRVETGQVFVAPDGVSIAVNASSIPSEITNTTAYGSETWIYDRTLGRITHHDSTDTLASWDGRRSSYNRTFPGSVVAGVVGVRDLASGLDDPITVISSSELAFAGNLSQDGRIALFQTSAGKVVDDVDGLADLYVLDRDPDGDGMASTWETQFGLNPSNGADATGDPDGDGVNNLAEFQRGSHPKGFHTRYLAEGASNAFFQTDIGIANPGLAATTVVTRFLGDNGRTWSGLFPIPARQERDVHGDGRFASSFSTVIESDQPVVADRVMTWGGGYGSHSETATAAPSTTWFLAEGATHGAFQLFYLLQNPAATTAHVTVTYLRPTPAAPIAVPYTIAAESRLTIVVDNVPGLAATDVSARIVSDVPILVERSMYMDTQNPPTVFGAGHAGSGVTAANPRWFLAEGATGVFFDMYYLIANPSTQATTVQVTYLLPNGVPLVKTYPVAAQSRKTIGVDFEDARLTDTPVSAIVESLDGVGIVVERSMWWPGAGQWQEGHLSAGSTVTSRRWAVAGGVIGTGVETFVLIANTSNVAGIATVTALRSHDGGAAAVRQVAMPANSRVNVPMSQVPGLAEPGGTTFGVLIESDGPEIVVERATYSDDAGIVWAAGHASLGTPLP